MPKIDCIKTIRESRKFISERGVPITGNILLNREVSIALNEVQEQIRELLLSLRTSTVRQPDEEKLIEAYATTVRSLVKDVFIVQMRAKNKPEFQSEVKHDLSKVSREDVLALGWEISSQLQDVISWLVTRGRTLSVDLFEKARRVLHYRDLKFLHALEKDPRFKYFTPYPNIFTWAVTGNVTNPRGYLENVQRTIVDVAKDPEFALFSKTPEIYEYIVISKLNADPKKRLRRMKEKVEVLMADPRFRALHDTPEVFIRLVAYHYTSDKRAFALLSEELEKRGLR